jgi:hypothetical protein
MTDFGQTWKKAFTVAHEVSSASDELVEDFVKIHSHTKDGGASENANGGVVDGGEKERDPGAFNQPRSIADFMRNFVVNFVPNSTSSGEVTSSDITNNNNTLGADDGSSEAGRDGAAGGDGGASMQRFNAIASCQPIEVNGTAKADNLSRQICRLWLKHTYLGLGKACPSDPCMRCHELPSNAKLLYKDNSFKGLGKAHRKTILAKAGGGSGGEDGGDNNNGGGGGGGVDKGTGSAGAKEMIKDTTEKKKKKEKEKKDTKDTKATKDTKDTKDKKDKKDKRKREREKDKKDKRKREREREAGEGEKSKKIKGS